MSELLPVIATLCSSHKDDVKVLMKLIEYGSELQKEAFNSLKLALENQHEIKPSPVVAGARGGMNLFDREPRLAYIPPQSFAVGFKRGRGKKEEQSEDIWSAPMLAVTKQHEERRRAFFEVY